MRSCVIALILTVVVATSVSAQVPHLAAYFDNAQTQMAKDCPPDPVGTVMDSIFVVAHQVNSWVSAFEFGIAYPASMLWVSDTLGGSPLVIGNTPTGIAITYPLPQNAFSPYQIMKVTFVWMCSSCVGGREDLVIGAGGLTGQIRAVSWPDNNLIPLTGLTSLVCADVPVYETTWGKIKSFYNN